MTDKTIARDYAARVLAHPGNYGTEEVAVARVLQLLMPARTLDEMTTAERAATVGMWATINPGDDSRAWRGIISQANRRVALVANPVHMRTGVKPTPVTANIVTPDPSVPRAWNADGTPAGPEPAPTPALPGDWRLAVHEKYGSIIVTALPSDSDDRAFFVHPDFEDDRGFDWQFCDPDDLTLDTEPKELK